MPDQTAAEPSMEDILASIRQIIAEDPRPSDRGATASLASTPGSEEDDVLLLTERVPESPEAAPMPPPAFDTPTASAAEPASSTATMRPADAPDEVAASFRKLSNTVQNEAQARAINMPPAGRSLEDLTRELLQPMMEAWLQTHLPAIVEARVEEEINRISRGRVR